MKVWVQLLVVTLGLLVMIFGFVLHLKFPSIMTKMLNAKLVIRADSPTINNFISAPIPIYMQFYFFNVTNPKEILNGEKAKVKQVGPYTYLEKRFKHELNWTDTTVEYVGKTTFFFQPNMSDSLSEDDLITTINPVLTTIASKLGNQDVSPEYHALLQVIILRFEISAFITKKAGELLFKGYDEPLFLELSKLTNDPLHKSGKFGFFYPKNGTDGGSYKISTGSNGLENLQLIKSWKNSSTLDYWPTDQCNMINGTTGSQFPKPILKENIIYLFASDLCRSLYFRYNNTIDYGGLHLLRYVLPYEVLAKTPENECYCSDNFTCRASVVNLSKCRNGAPVLASTPHFYMGDRSLVEEIDGLNPNQREHDTYIDVEPNTGVSFGAMKRIQISMPLKRYADLPQLNKVREVILPILWLNESAKVPLEKAEELYSKLNKPLVIADVVCFILYALGGVMIIIPIIFFIKQKCINMEEYDTAESEPKNLKTKKDEREFLEFKSATSPDQAITISPNHGS